MRHRWGSVRVRTTLAATVLTAIVLIVGSIAIVGIVERSLVGTARETLVDLVREIDLPAGDAERSRRFALIADGDADGDDVLVLMWPELRADDPRTSVVGLLVESGDDEPIAQVVLDRDDLVVRELLDGFGLQVADGDLPLRIGDRIDPGDEVDGDAARLLSDAALYEVQESIDAVVTALVLIVPLLTVILGLAIWFTVGRALRPVHAISAQVDRIGAGTLDERVPVPPTRDEIAELALTMNRMLDRLEAGAERQRRFVADASHELRSPLSTIKAAAEVAQASPDPGRFGELADDVAAEAARMEELITDLLDLARLDEQRRGPTAPVRLDEVCRAAIERLPAGDIKVRLDVVEAVVDGVEAQLERAVFNLVLNAIQYARTSVVVEVRAGEAGVALSVDDDGPGIDGPDRQRVFERFERLDASRQRDSGGAGIGLALVRAIAERHEGTVHVEGSAALGGARFVLWLPAAPGRD